MNESANIVQYIKENYPKVVFTPVNFSKVLGKNSALGFVITDNKFVVGYISKNGNLCKIVDPVDLNDMSRENFVNLIKKIPLIEGFDENDKTRLIQLLQVGDSPQEVVEQLKELKVANERLQDTNKIMKEKYEMLDAEYKVLVNVSNNDKINILLVKKDSENKMNSIKEEYTSKIKALEEANEECKTKILYEKELIVQSIQTYKQNMDQYLKETFSKNKNMKDAMIKIIDQLKSEKYVIERRLSELEDHERKRLEELESERDKHTDFSFQLQEKQDTIVKMTDIINAIKNELQQVQDNFSRSELENKILKEFKTNCLEQILSEKETIIRRIKEYNEEWMAWANEKSFNIEKYKDKLKTDFEQVYNKLTDVFKHKEDYISSLNLDRKSKQQVISNLNGNISEIKLELNKAIASQLQSLSVKESDGNSSNSNSVLLEKDSEIRELKNQLEQVRSLLHQNNNTPNDKTTDYDDCYKILQKFISVNNMFYRKKQIIDILDKIIFNESHMTVFTNLSKVVKNNIKRKYESIRDEIKKHIDFLDLGRYVNSPNIELFKKKSTVSKVPSEFCDDLTKISIYWDDNIEIYREQDKLLTNLYEDLSGAVRVYIKIKPLIGSEQKNNTVYIDSIQNKKQKRVVIDCSLAENLDREVKRETYGDFYGIFDETFSNLDVYTGIEGSKTISGKEFEVEVPDEKSDTVSPGLYSTFQQVEDGYSIVLFGYGLSGSGKTRLLVGESNVPGILHYGLYNLRNVENIKIKNMFEQYVDKFTPTLNLISGKIHNLVGIIPQLSENKEIKVTVDETKEFAQEIPSSLKLSNVSVDDLYTLTSILEKYRIKQGRVKKTPNNSVSSRSHLYIVFEVKFLPKDGEPSKTGYITVVDTAGRESPMDIFDLFMDQTGKYKISLTTVLGPTGGPGIVEKYLKKQYKSIYKPTNVYDILKEGVYINETINHLIYFFNKKNYKKTNIVQQKDLDHYSNSKYYVNPKEEETKIQGSNNALTIPIMRFLDNLSNKNLNPDEFKPSKFVTFVCLRKDLSYCSQIFSSLEFASSIRSS